MANDKDLLGGRDTQLPFCAHTNDAAPLFVAEAYDNREKKMKQIRLADYRGRWVVLFFYSSDFTFV